MNESIVLADEIRVNDPSDNHTSDNEHSSDIVENIDENSSYKSSTSTQDDSDNIECNICGKLYKRKAHLLKHLMSHKSENSSTSARNSYRKRNYIFVCNKCGKRFSKSKALQNHENEGDCVEQEVNANRIIFPRLHNLNSILESSMSVLQRNIFENLGSRRTFG